MADRRGSLVRRLVVITAVMLILALGLTGFSLDRGFRESARAALRDRLEAHLYGLMGLVDVGPAGEVSLPGDPAEPRLTTADSGLYAAVWDGSGQPLWRSPSALGRALGPPPADGASPGHVRFGHQPGEDTYRLALTVRWETDPAVQRRLTFTVAESADRFRHEVAGFRRALWGWLAASALFLVAAHGVLLRLGLKPLLRLARDVKAIETGRRDRFPADYPRELTPLTENMNALLDQDRQRLARYRDSLGDLAHSLKTPLAILHGIREEARADASAIHQMGEQLGRMQAALDYHLQRAATAGRAPLSRSVELAPVVAELERSLAKVHDGKAVHCSCEVAADLRFRGDRGDLVEMLGNLMDNAWKWCAGRVRVAARVPANAGGVLEVVVEDDGPGVSSRDLERLGERGFRPRGEAPGHGIGLALVRALATEYGESPRFDRSPLGGLRITLHLHP